MAAPIKVLVVDDSALTRQILTRALAMDPRVEVVGVARNGLEAIERAKELRPDVVTLDIAMPVLSGLEALPFLMRDTTARVVVLSSVDDAETAYEALDAGAIDFIGKPKGGFASTITELSETLLKKIKIAARVPPEKRVERPNRLVEALVSQPAEEAGALPPLPIGGEPAAGTTVAVAASTGGPPALERVFAGLTADIPAAYVLVQHLPAGFTGPLVQRLRRVTDIRVLEAEDRMPIERGFCYVAPHGFHMTVRRGRVTAPRVLLTEGPPLHGVRPAADPLIESVARTYGRNSVGVLLSGMGADGVEGLGRVVDAGGRTIVQDEGTSVVWGMPGAAVRAGVAQAVIPLDGIAGAIREAVEGAG